MGAEAPLMLSPKAMPSDDVPQQMLTLLVELLRSGELSELESSAAFGATGQCMLLRGSTALGSVALQLGLMELAAEHLRALGSPADVVSISRGKAGGGYGPFSLAYQIVRSFSGQAARPDLAAFVSSGLFDICVKAHPFSFAPSPSPLSWPGSPSHPLSTSPRTPRA